VSASSAKNALFQFDVIHTFIRKGGVCMYVCYRLNLFSLQGKSIEFLNSKLKRHIWF